MAGKDNLTPFRSVEEAREAGRKGGVASGKTRRRKKAMKQAAAMLLNMDVSSSGAFGKEMKKRLVALGLDEDDVTYQDALLASILLEAMKGDVRAAEFMRDTAGESPYMDVKKQELKLRKEELRFRQELEMKKGANEAESEEGEKEAVHIYLPDNGRGG